ncbi:MAG: hypothetical protein Q7R64_02905, partial [bacterium]|nr:hypothetical protein [bacterium]
MKIIAHTTTEIKGEVTPPSSKSQTIRGLIFATLAKGTSALKNPLHSQDTADAIRACRALGAEIFVKADRIVIESEGVPLQSNTTLNTGNSGVTTHFLMPVTGLRGSKGGPITFDCGEQMKQRPVESLVTALQRLGLKLHTQSQHPRKSLKGDLKGQGGKGKQAFPLQISGELFGGKATVSGASSQYLSALLISLPCAQNDSVITVNDLQERPYVEMTEQWLKEQGIVYSHQREDLGFKIKDVSKTNTTTSASPRLTGAVHFSHPEDETLKVLRSSTSSLLTSSTEEEMKNQATRDVYTIKGGHVYKPFIKTIPADFSS